jgi:hypothetical protein
MANIVKILMKRDGITEEEARNLVDETRDLLISSNPFEAEDIMADQLGLELDYVMDVLYI